VIQFMHAVNGNMGRVLLGPIWGEYSTIHELSRTIMRLVINGTGVGYGLYRTISIMSAKSIITTAAIALAAGAALGLLLAPASGRDTRKKIRKQAASAKQALGEMLLEATELVDTIRSRAEEATLRTGTATSNISDEAVKGGKRMADGA